MCKFVSVLVYKFCIIYYLGTFLTMGGCTAYRCRAGKTVVFRLRTLVLSELEGGWIPDSRCWLQQLTTAVSGSLLSQNCRPPRRWRRALPVSVYCRCSLGCPLAVQMICLSVYSHFCFFRRTSAASSFYIFAQLSDNSSLPRCVINNFICSCSCSS